MKQPNPYQKNSRWLALFIVVANGLGALLSMVYFSFVDPVPASENALNTLDAITSFLFSAGGTALLLVLGTWLSGKVDEGFSEWYSRLVSGEPADNVPLDVRLRVLNYPAATSLVSLSMWLLAAFFFNYLPSGGRLDSVVRLLGVGGALTVSLVYFGLEMLWRPVIQVFFPHGRLTEYKKVFRLSIFLRLLVVFILVGIYPVAMLSVVMFSKANKLLGAENPQLVLENMMLAGIFVLGVIAFLGTAYVYFARHAILLPIQNLQDAMSRVQQGDLQVEASVVSNDELGFLADRFNEMVAGLRRAEMLRNLLNLYVSPEVARAALEGGTNLGGQVVNCTILFSDIRGFTSLSEKLPPDQLILLLNRYMSRMVDVVIANGGIVNKFGGDSLLAIFGTPLNPDTDHAARAIHSALEMQTALRDFNAEQAKLGQPELRIGIGIATGPAVAGNIGGEGRVEYTVIGDTVNLASRLQDLTKELKRDILINATAFEQAKPKNAEPLTPVTVRGKADVVAVYAIADY